MITLEPGEYYKDEYGNIILYSDKHKDRQCFRCGMSEKDLRRDYEKCKVRGKYYGRHLFTIKDTDGATNTSTNREVSTKIS